ncbi:MAG: hypothetical protein AAFW70_16690 [Cyanobacteria bacterium J06635_10]
MGQYSSDKKEAREGKRSERGSRGDGEQRIGGERVAYFTVLSSAPFTPLSPSAPGVIEGNARCLN